MSDETASERAATEARLLHRFWSCELRAIIEARCKLCGKQVAVYYARDPDCPECTAENDGEGWRGLMWCKCDRKRVLPDRSALARDISRGYAAERKFLDRAPITRRV